MGDVPRAKEFAACKGSEGMSCLLMSCTDLHHKGAITVHEHELNAAQNDQPRTGHDASLGFDRSKAVRD